MNPSELFIRRPVTTTLLSLALVIFGVIAFRLLPVSNLPNIDFPTISVNASLPGANPETMAASVATPLERQFSAIPGLDSMTSTSSLGTTSITLSFELSRSIDAAAQDVQTAIAAASRQLPPGMPTPPTLKKVNPADSPVFFIALSSATLPISTVDQYAETQLAQSISAIDGAAAHGVFARTYTERSDLAVAAKNAIAAEAALMVQDGDAVIVHGGSTCFRLGERLAARNIRLCTNSMPLAAMLGEIGSCALTVVGGELHREPRILHGPTGGTPFFASKFFLSAQGVSERGLLESHPLLVDAISRFAECSDRIIALIDSSKFTTGARKLALPWSRIDTIITDDGLAAEHRAMLEAKGVEVRIAAVRTGEQ